MSAFKGKIGVARRDVTPPVGIYNRNWGAAARDTATGVHRPFFVTALALQSEESGERALLIALDGGWWQERETEWKIRAAVIEALGLSESQVMFNLSHTHAGAPLVAGNRERPGGHFIEPYLEALRKATVEAAEEGMEKAAPAFLTWGNGACGLAVNRDFKDPAGGRFLCGNNPEEEADSTLLVGRVTDLSGKIIATLVNYACHPTTLGWLNSLLSPDFPGSLRETVETRTQGAPCLFLQGASGELQPAQVYEGDPAVADRHGRTLGYATLSVLESLLPPGDTLTYKGVVESGAVLAMWSPVKLSPSFIFETQKFTVSLEIKKDFPEAVEIKSRLEGCSDRLLKERLSRQYRLRQVVGPGRQSDLNVWLWRLGDAIVVGSPAESYSDLQIALRNRFPQKPIVVMNLVNGGYAYLPPERLYGENLYQVWQTPYARGGLEHLIKRCISKMETLIGEKLSPA